MVSRDLDSGMVEIACSEVPGSEILMSRQIEERPHRDFLMHQQGFFSGKTEGDLDSVPGYYGGTASYKFVQNAKHLNQLRVTRYKTNYVLGEHYDEYGRVVSDSPAAKLRAEALAVAKAVPSTPYSSVGPDMAFKRAGEHGAYVPSMFNMQYAGDHGAFAVPSPHLAGISAKTRGGFSDGIYVPNIYVPPSHTKELLTPPRLSEGQQFFRNINAPKPAGFYDAYGAMKPYLIA